MREMFAHLEERYQAYSSVVHRLDPRTKLIVTAGLIVAISLLPMGKWAIYGAVWLLLLAVSFAAGIGASGLVRRSFVALPFALAALALPFTVPGTVLAHVPWAGWTITVEGLERAGSIVVKSWVSVQVAILLVMTTALPDLMWALRALRMPPVLVAIVSFMYRYLYVLAEEAGRLLRARAARSAALPGQRAGNTLWWRGKVAGYMVGSLMMRSFERSEHIYHAMAARGYTGQLRSLTNHHFALRDGVAMASTAALLVVMLLAAQR